MAKKVEVAEEIASFGESLRPLIGQPIACICARYQYRGILSNVTKNGDAIIIAQAKSVEVSGPSAAEKPQTEDDIQGSVTVKTDAIEIAYQPRWVWDGFERGKKVEAK